MAVAGISNRVEALPIQAIHTLNWSPRDEARYLLCIAVQEPHKNLVRLVEAWSRADTQDFMLVICGRPGEETKSLLDAVSSSMKADSIKVTSGLSDDEYLDLLNGCWGYIQPSLYEGLCIPALDVAAAGVPSAVSTSGNLGNIYLNTPKHQVFDALSVPEMACSIESLLHDADFRRQASQWNLTNVKVTDWREVASVALAGMQ
ncbi:glycosyltransferase [Arthrobacter sp. B10-11]|uniref:glycosyltransferase n=1 Tax=Arthrobacter sp. B10-11 TaxID=3081160 RepID=UPI0029553715|nr:glycosyltransferase [Arthrobacter sp. B10-11]MDV8146991.1 glycosyltransferase [Arthrobacter sp. B10-11]